MNKPFGTIVGEKAQKVFNAIKSIPTFIVKNAVESTKNKQKKLTEMITDLNKRKKENIKTIKETKREVTESIKDYRDLDSISKKDKNQSHDALTKNLKAIDEEKTLKKEEKSLEVRKTNLEEELKKRQETQTKWASNDLIRDKVSSSINFQTAKIKAFLAGKNVTIADRSFYANMQKTVKLGTLIQMAKVSEQLDFYKMTNADLQNLKSKKQSFEEKSEGLTEIRNTQAGKLEETEDKQIEWINQVQEKQERIDFIRQEYQTTAKDAVGAIKESAKEMKKVDDFSRLNPNYHIKPSSSALDSLHKEAVKTSISIDTLNKRIDKYDETIATMINKLVVTENKLNIVNANIEAIARGVDNIKTIISKQEERILKTMSESLKDMNINNVNQFEEIKPNINQTLEETPFTIK